MKIVIIGNGVAGTNAARFIRKMSDHQVVMISDETLRPFSRTALMYVYMGHMKQENTELYEDWFWEKNRIQRVFGRVEQVDTNAKKIVLADGQTMSWDKLIIATGSRPNKLGWPGQDLKGVQGLYHLSDLSAMEKRSAGLQRAVIVGGGLIGIEMAEMFHSRHIPVTFLVRENSFWNNVIPSEESSLINRHIREHGIDLQLGEELDSIIDDGTGQVGSIKTKSGKVIDCGFVGLTIGVRPNIDFLKNSGIETAQGVLADDYLRTSHPDVYAIGDCAQMREPQPGRRAIEAVWYTGRMMGQTVAKTICQADTPYRPGIWFNSAKFFDIETQVYGHVPPQTPDHIRSLYWEHPEGRKSIRINFQVADGAVTGFNLFGIRYRHEVCEQWILNRTSIETVLPQLKLANFDPEFFDAYEKHLIDQYNQLNNKQLHLKSSRSIDQVNRLLQSFSVKS